ncbi:replication protein RepA [Kaistia dalseonensis]|uniref:Pirin n=1 Tax=Kaistia dalseonensis TaxID=410840 RepID=A0ABU0HF98_9HYPH|nr:replication protein RepA [Kaistia dalseonensis]MCX5497874.1 replication protein RepA [Kaistia dalseonensis]MDQ0440518.1 hypothetical protein [Kaistia dalseonensis]
MERRDESLLQDSDLIERLRRYDAGQRLGAPGSRSLFIDQLLEEQAARQRKVVLINSLPRDAKRRAEWREDIDKNGLSADSLRFMPTPLAICGLPHRRLPADQTEYERQQGRMSLVVTAGKLRAPNGERLLQPVPWGPKARLIMAHLSTEALRNRSPVVETADTLKQFMDDMGFKMRGGAHGTIAPFKEQLRALAACRMEFSKWDGRRSAQIDVKPLEKVELWFSDNPDQRSLWPTTITFSQQFYDELVKHALPVDVRALMAFSASSRKIDLLLWLTFRMTRLSSHYVLDWARLKEQFGDGFARDRKFRETFAAELASIHELFPKVPARLTERGLEMGAADPSAFAIPTRIRA